MSVSDAGWPTNVSYTSVGGLIQFQRREDLEREERTVCFIICQPIPYTQRRGDLSTGWQQKGRISMPPWRSRLIIPESDLRMAKRFQNLVVPWRSMSLFSFFHAGMIQMMEGNFSSSLHWGEIFDGRFLLLFFRMKEKHGIC